ncbi:MAG: hypothetical protein HYS08_05965 [Chlamydiae bacterium]|nr:hypothetical protein [Chlamydiota bacterium]MBI3266438.1 hypothetical protein [Chlamydiota bacterium]
MKKFLSCLMCLVLGIGFGMAQDSENNQRERRPPEMMRHPDDVVLDYRGLIQQIDEMRRHEEDVMHQLEDVSKKYEEGLQKLQETQEKFEKELNDFQKWHEESVKAMKDISQNSQPTEIKGEVRGAPSDRYFTR